MRKVEQLFLDESSPGVSVLPVGEFFFQASRACSLFLGGKSCGEPVALLRIACLDETELKVDSPAGVTWCVRPIRVFEPADSVPHEALLTLPRPETMEEMLRRIVAQQSYHAQERGEESFDEANDFELEDEDGLPMSDAERVQLALDEVAGMSDEDVLLALDERRRASQQPPAEKPAAPPAAAPEVKPGTPAPDPNGESRKG